MKKVIRTAAAVALLFSIASGFAKEPKLETVDNTKSLVLKWDAQMVATSLKIFDKDGNAVYTEYIDGIDTYTKKFDLAPLAKGEYYLEVENAIKEVTYVIEVGSLTVDIVEVMEKAKPVFKNDNGLVTLNFFNKDAETVNIKVFDVDGRELFKEKFEDSLVIAKAFNFEKAIKGEYTIAVKKESETFYETIIVK